jgi:hypothetical protein
MVGNIDGQPLGEESVADERRVALDLSGAFFNLRESKIERRS